MKPTRRDPPRRVTPELMAFYKSRAHQLRHQACQDIWRALWVSLLKIIRRR